MRRPATWQDRGESYLWQWRHNCGGNLSYSYNVNHSSYLCAKCGQHWASRTMHAFTDTQLAERFWIELPTVEGNERLVWVREKDKVYTTLTKLPVGTPGLEPFTGTDW